MSLLRRHRCAPCTHQPNQDTQRAHRALLVLENHLSRARRENWRLEHDNARLRAELTAATREAP